MSVPTPPAGIHSIPDRDYFAIDLPSSSATKTLLTGTNAHLAHERDQPREETDAFSLGALLHALVLSPHTVETDFIAVGQIDRRTKDGKAAWESAQARAAQSGARIVTDDQVRVAEAMADAIAAHPSASALLNAATKREVTIIGDIGGRPAKAKIDAVAEMQQPEGTIRVLIDLKTTESAGDAFAGSAAKFGYFHQAAWYMRLASQHLSGVEEFAIIAVEKSAPHLVAVYKVSQQALWLADKKLDSLADRWYQVQAGDRTGYPETVTELEPPRWWLSTEENERNRP